VSVSTGGVRNVLRSDATSGVCPHWRSQVLLLTMSPATTNGRAGLALMRFYARCPSVRDEGGENV
jgi:hypothetical protein